MPGSPDAPQSALSKSPVLTIGGAVCLLPSLIYWILWIRISSLPYLSTRSSRIAAFLAHFPTGFSFRTLSLLVFTIELLAIILSGAGVLSADRVQKGINIAVLAISMILFVLSAIQLL